MASSIYESINRTHIQTSVNYNILLVYRNQPKRGRINLTVVLGVWGWAKTGGLTADRIYVCSIQIISKNTRLEFPFHCMKNLSSHDGV